MGLLILLVILLSGTLGYFFIEGWDILSSFYMTIITISTVGFMEVKPLSTGGRIFTSVLILLGVGFMFYMLSYLVQYFIEERLEAGFLRRMRNRIGKLKDHVILCGYGRVGKEVSSHLEEDGVPFVVVEMDREEFEEAKRKGFLCIQGDATRDEVLKEAGVERAKAIVITTGDDAYNLSITLTAKYLNPNIMVIVRASSDESEPKLLRAGADKVILPHKLGGRRMARLVSRPLLVDFIDTVLHGKNRDFIVEDIKVSPKSPLIGKKKRELESPEFYIIAIRRGDGELIPSPSSWVEIYEGDELIVMGSKERIKELGG